MTWLGSSVRGALVLATAAAAGCFDSGARPDRVPPPPPGPAAVDLTQTYQRIDGFGASSAWTGSNIPDAMADLFFSPETGIGLSLLRIQIKPEGNTLELPTAQKAAARGAKVWAAPWSPPGEWKTNGMAKNGGSLLDDHRQDWANRLATFVSSMTSAGVPLLALSAQNEPNYQNAGWETCIYSPGQLVVFIRDFLGPALAAQGQTVPVMAPETQGWDKFKQYADPLFADPATVPMLGPIATHHYAGTPYAYEPALAAGKVTWETEVSDGAPYDPNEAPIDSGLRTAAMIHDDLVQGGVSAWHYWWLMPQSGSGNSALANDTTKLALRAWVFGNWSRFVRPGFARVAVTPLPQTYVYVSAFADQASHRLVVVAINQGYADLPQDFTIAGGTATEVTPWVTSGTQQLAAQAAVPVAGGVFTATLPARSVTSFVATVTP
jgi:glucuronoarabinoxylan endo-1,4-beta-xylanase